MGHAASVKLTDYKFAEQHGSEASRDDDVDDGRRGEHREPILIHQNGGLAADLVGSDRFESARMEREATARAWSVGMVGVVIGEACNAAAARSPRGVFGVHVPTDALVV